MCPPTTTCAGRTTGNHGHVRGRPSSAFRPGSRPFAAPGADHFGEVQAWNVDTGQRVWTHNYAKSPNWGAMLATAGGLVFSGGTNDRKIHAFDASSGKLLWEFADQLGHPGAADVVPDRRQAVHRRGVGMGRRLARDAGDAQSAVSRRVSGSAGRRRRVGVRRGP